MPAAAGRLTTTTQTPSAPGYRVTTVSATAFYPEVETDCGPYCIGDYSSSGSLGRRGTLYYPTEFYANLDLPGGAVIDYIGLNSLTDADYAFGVSLFQRHFDGSAAPIASLSSVTHAAWDTDFNDSPIGYVWQGRTGDALVINVEQAIQPNFEWFGWVEVWWKPSVSPPPATASFVDVPTTDPLFQYVEALKASGITGGCQQNPPMFCPSASLTRGQMAAFLSKAIGLYWPAQAGGAYTVTTVPALAFYPASNNAGAGFFDTATDLSRFSTDPYVYEDFYTALDLPGGAVIDYIGLNSQTDTDGAVGAELLRRHKDGGLTSIQSLSSTVHGFDTDFNPTARGYVWPGASGDALILHVQTAPNANPEYFGWVEIWWKRSVSPAPATATFNDVPTTNPYFQFVEALAASGITGGCGANPPLYCPDHALTRGQMAVFLAKALGLHWPGN
jgi:hypothetical protein